MTVFCVGHNINLSSLRAQVLRTAGIDAHFGNPQSLDEIRAVGPSVVLVSFEVSAEEAEAIQVALGPSAKLIKLVVFTTPQVMIEKVKIQLSEGELARRSIQ